jgi:Ca2+-transporting ATPase
MPADDVAAQLKVDPAKELSSSEAQQRLQQYGPNRLAGKKKESGWQAFLRQYKDFMQIILVAAAVINFVFTRELSTTLVLLGLTVFNAVLGMRQESKAEASLAALEKMMKNIARVRRDGQAVEIEAEQLVPGDIVLMEAGNRVPADGRLFVTATLEIEEAACRLWSRPFTRWVHGCWPARTPSSSGRPRWRRWARSRPSARQRTTDEFAES